ncbi:hypothetical protein [Anaeromicropila populeti]|nr:hypothetical protein [Anaeromicropila populeti]
MIENFQKFFSHKPKFNNNSYGTGSMKYDITDDAEDYFVEDSYMNNYDAEDEFFD